MTVNLGLVQQALVIFTLVLADLWLIDAIWGFPPGAGMPRYLRNETRQRAIGFPHTEAL